MRQDVAYGLILLMVLGAGYGYWRWRTQRRRRRPHMRVDLTGGSRERGDRADG